MAGKHRRGRHWYLSWYQGARLHRASIGPVTEAEAEAARLAKEQSLTATAAAGPAFCEWAVTYATWHAAEYPDSYPRVEGIIRCHLLPVFRDTPIAAITRHQVESYKHARLATGAAAGTVVKELRTLQAMLNAAVAWDTITRNPVARVRAPRDTASRPPRWYTAVELDALYRAELAPQPCSTAADREHHRRYRWLWQLLANTGLRRSEALHLQWRDIGADELRVRSEPGARTKSGRWRAVPITAGAREALSHLHPDHPDAAVADRRSDPAAWTAIRPAYVAPQIDPISLTRAFRRTAGRAGLDGGIHALRHTYCSHLAMRGVPLRQIQALAGHASARTTEQYAHLAPGAFGDLIRGLDL